MKAVAKAAEVTPEPEQLALDFDGRIAAAAKKRAKAPRVKKAPAGIDIPAKPKG